MSQTTRFTRVIALVLAAGACAAGSAGCSDKLETGYQPRQLGVSAAERKAYYASPYTPEAAAAGRAQQAEDFRSMRRPGASSQY